eukprot:CAMPEP_0119569552 /NCGR_PEP_ID=MMETSP1352-20130426/42029_1 /TAXON_ID=265584 /ORGANISM="Stauroneis constricta, Strain CCMP1120" /LENGTH=104 /DNA_ID=CAMNT_0007619125 /DNA_START=54 /DNA_END=364 /DNA_ORIENTATION=+
MPLLFDPVTNIVKSITINEDIPKAVVSQTQNEFRGMKIRHRQGTFGKIDHELSRAAALLEYVARELKGIRIPLKVLAKAACVSEKKFKNFHLHVGNFRRQNGNV